MPSKPKTHSIYHLVDPRDHSVRYVGKSTNPRSRYRVHCQEAAERQDTAKQRWIAELSRADLQPVLLIIASYPDEASARQRESRECHQHRATILNIHDPAKGAADFATQSKQKTAAKTSPRA